MKKNIVFIGVCFISIWGSLCAQQSPIKCATDYSLQKSIEADPELAVKYQMFKESLPTESLHKTDGEVYKIPVVFHIIHNGDAYGTGENVPDERIYEQLEVLNTAFRKRNADTSLIPAEFAPLAADAEIEFCLARFDTLGRPFSGIERINMGVAAYDENTIQTMVKPNTIWNRDKYYNIWVCRFTGDLSSVLGYAQFPGMGPLTDGVVLRYDAIGVLPTNASPQGKTAVHETGHYFGLFHIWGDDQDDANTCLGSDLVDDTPNQSIQNFGCPTHPKTTCGSHDMFMNYMDYTDDDCSHLFTQGQVTRMREAYFTYRSSFAANAYLCDYGLDVEVSGFISPTDSFCSGEFDPMVEVKNLGTEDVNYIELLYSIDGGSNLLISWEDDLPSGESRVLRLPHQTLGVGAHTITATAFNANREGNDRYAGNDTKSKVYYIVSNSIGQALPYTQDFETAGLPANWLTDNPDGDRTWTHSNAAGAASTSSYYFDNFTSSGGPFGKRDGLISPTFDFSTVSFPVLSFDYAYAMRSSTTEDSLIVYYSTDCNKTWNRLWYKGGADLATAASTTVLFIPSSGQWVNKSFDLHFLEGSPNVSFKFENLNDLGNNLYIDNVNLHYAPTGILHDDARMEVHVYPNPTKNRVIIEMQITSEAVVSYQMIDVNAKVVLNGLLDSSKTQLYVGSLSEGLYFIKLTDPNGNVMVKKVNILK